LKNRLTNKTNEATSLSRQLELALNDSKSKEEHIKDKYASKVMKTLFFINRFFIQNP
jgi:hypothetical protein